MRRTSRVARAGRSQAVVADGSQARAISVRPVVLKIGLAMAGVGVLAASAWISVPFYPVPLTMQTLAVLLVGGLLGPKAGVAAVVGYLALGIAGAPVFHNGVGGAIILVGPTGGYLLGFVPAAFLMGMAGDRAAESAGGRFGALRRLGLLAIGALSAEAALYALGLPWLALVTGMGAEGAVSVGLVPFLLGDLVKMAVAVLVLYGGRSLLSRRGPQQL